jgi:Ca-activated chloride channel family protein
MQGQSIIQAKKSLLLALDQLNDQDRFNILSFNDKTTQLFYTSVPAISENLAQAKAYIQTLQAGGGTEMMPALQESLEYSAYDERVRQVIFITDGAVSNEEKLFQEIYKNLGQSRLFTVGIGSAPNSYFMRKAAEFGRGSFTHVGDVNVVQERMTRLLSKLNKPLIKDITIEWPKGSVVEQYPKKIPDLYEGEPLLINASVKNMSGVIKLKGKQHGGVSWEKTLSIGSDVNHLGIATLWAREKIEHLLDQKIKGLPEQEVRRSVLEVALTHQLMSPYTSFVAVEQDQNQDLEAKPQLRSIPIPKTATRATLSLLWGGGLLLFFMIVKISMKKEEDYELDN